MVRRVSNSKVASVVTIALLAACFGNAVLAGGANFASFPAEREASNDAIQAPDFDGRDNWADQFRSHIKSEMLKGANFAGHYRMMIVGCGTGCGIAHLGDLTNGQVFSFPYGGEENFELKLDYQTESRLVKATWIENLSACVQTDLEFTGTTFEIVDEIKSNDLEICR